MDKVRLSEVFNLGFRCGANDRGASGVAPSGETPEPTGIPVAPAECSGPMDQRAWAEGYSLGYRLGASDDELASVAEPGAHGMISGFGEQMLEMFGVFDRLSDTH